MEIKVMEAEVLDGFKMTELGVLPKEWDVVKLQNAFEFTRKPRNLNSKYYNKIPFIPMEYVPDEEIYASRYDLKSPKEIRSGTFFSKGDLLVAKITPSFENGKQCIVENLPVDFGYATTEVWPLRGKNNSHLLYLFYYLKKQNIRNDIAGKMEGSTGRQRVPKNVLGNLRIPLPPLPEQQRIAAVLSAVQEAKEKTEEVIKAVRELKKSLMHHLFTYGAVPVGDAGDVVLKETEIGAVPEEWEVVKLKDISEMIMGHSPKGDSYNVNGGGVPLINGPAEFGKLFPSILKWTTKPTKICDYGDILFCVRGNTTGRMNVANSKYCIGRGVAAIRGNRNHSDTQYLFYFLKKKAQVILLYASGGGSTFPNITKSQLECLLFPLPPLPEQHRIAEILSTIDKKIQTEENRKNALNSLFKTLLDNLMTAKIRVNNLNIKS